MRFRWLISGLFLLTTALRADELPLELQALDQAIQAAVARADRCVVGVIIGRDEAYARHEGKQTRGPGELGRFDPRPLLAKLPEDDLVARRRIEDLDLAAPGAIPEASATGLVLDKTGLILIPAHAIARARKIYVKLHGGKGSYADIHALDTRSDLAVLRLLDPPEGLQPAALGDGSVVRRGQLVLLLANPFAAGFREPSPTASWGMVTNLRQSLPSGNDNERVRRTLHHFGTLLQIDSRLSLPTSGGIVLNLKGEVVALMTAHAAVLGPDRPGADTPAGFAIPLDDALRRIIAVLRNGEEVEYGFLGIRPSLVPGRGVEVSSVSQGSPARTAGFVGGEILLRIDGQPINNQDDLFLAAGTKLAGTTVKVEYQLRPGVVKTVPLTLAKFWVPTPGIFTRQPEPRCGLRVDWTSLVGQRRGTDVIPSGVLIREVVPGSSAAKAGLQPDEVITRVGQTRVTTPEEFYKAMSAVPGDVEVTLEGRDQPVKLTR